MRPSCGLVTLSSTATHSLSLKADGFVSWRMMTGSPHVSPPSSERWMVAADLGFWISLRAIVVAYTAPSGPNATTGSEARSYTPPTAWVRFGRLPVVHV